MGHGAARVAELPETPSLVDGAFRLEGRGSGLSLFNGTFPDDYSVVIRYELDPIIHNSSYIYFLLFGLCRQKIVDFPDLFTDDGYHEFRGFADGSSVRILTPGTGGTSGPEGIVTSVLARDALTHTMRLFIDGRLVATHPDVDGAYSLSGPSAAIHFSTDDSLRVDDPMFGSVDQIQIFDRALASEPTQS